MTATPAIAPSTFDDDRKVPGIGEPILDILRRLVLQPGVENGWLIAVVLNTALCYGPSKNHTPRQRLAQWPLERRISYGLSISGAFASAPHRGRVSVTLRDVRCSMVNFDSDSGRADPEVLKAIVRTHRNTAGVYGTVIRIGRLTVGQTVRFQEFVEE